jgi:hypothetical protein
MSTAQISDFNHFLLWEQASRDAIMVKRVYIDMAGDVIAGLMLSQIIYWHLPNNQGETRLRVVKDGYLWLAKSHSDWWEECRLTVDQARRALKVLQEKGLVVTALKQFNGAPTNHIRLEQNRFLDELNRFGLQPKSIRDRTQMEMSQNPNPFGIEPGSYKQTLHTDTTTNTTAAEAPAELPKRRRAAKGSAAAVSEGEEKNTDPDTLALVAALIAADLNRADAQRLARTKPDECRLQLAYLPFKTDLENPGGYLRSAIEGSFPPPKEYKAAKAKEERERKKRDEANRRQAQEAAQKAAEAAEALRVDEYLSRLETEAPETYSAFIGYVETKKAETEAKFQSMPPTIRARMLADLDTVARRRELFAAWQAQPRSEPHTAGEWQQLSILDTSPTGNGSHLEAVEEEEDTDGGPIGELIAASLLSGASC